jgi:predicted transcriptional regulator
VSGPYNDHPPFVAGSDTSALAAESMAASAASIREQVYGWMARRGDHGATDDEIERALSLRHQTASARRRELELIGRVQKTDERRRTSSGRSAAVYIAQGLQGVGR